MTILDSKSYSGSVSSAEAVTESYTLPTAVKVGAVTYQVKYETRLADDAMMGNVRVLEGTIDIRPNMSASMEKITLLHEVIHAILFQAGEKEHDEQVIDIVAHGILQVFQDNKGLLA